LSLIKVLQEGVSAFDLYGTSITAKDCIKAEELLKMNYGVDYPVEKFSMLWEMIQEEKWTAERLRAALKWFLKNKKWATWTIADWFDYDIKLFPHSWYVEKINEGYKDSDFDCYKINGQALWTLKNGTELPFEKI
jgi:hypothetical protein